MSERAERYSAVHKYINNTADNIEEIIEYIAIQIFCRPN